MKPRSCITRRKSDRGWNTSVKLGPSGSFAATFTGASRRAQLCAPPGRGRRPRLFARAALVGADVDPTPARRSCNVDRRGFRRIAGSNRSRLGSQVEVIDELRGVKTDKHSPGAEPVNDVVVAVYARVDDAPIQLPVHISDDLASPVSAEADVVIHSHIGTEVINGEAGGDIVSDDHIVG